MNVIEDWNTLSNNIEINSELESLLSDYFDEIDGYIDELKEKIDVLQDERDEFEEENDNLKDKINNALWELK
jgi:ElaB/YqjD/DUF883 family membrane-anchored ribosome-binding protein